MKNSNFIKGFTLLYTVTDNNTLSKVYEYSKADLVGPSICIRVNTNLEKSLFDLPLISVDTSKYDYGDILQAIGIDETIMEMAKEYYKENGSFILISKFGNIIINSESVNKIFSDFRKTISIF